VIHNINYKGLDLEVIGEYDPPEEETGYKGGWSTEEIKINDVDCYSMFKDSVIGEIAEKVIEKNY
jgi:hypothetical protein